MNRSEALAGSAPIDDRSGGGTWNGAVVDWLDRAGSMRFTEADLARLLTAFIDAGLDVAAPHPGAGNTLARWQGLARICGMDLSLGKLVEAHLDAVAILDDLQGAPPAAHRLAIWAAEPPDARLQFSRSADGGCRISGRKSWCSGAWSVDSALVTGWDSCRQPVLALVTLDQSGVTRTRDGWAAVGMLETQSVDVVFDGAIATAIGTPRAYLDRPGFWHGGAGIAACWYGAAVSQAEVLRAAVATRDDPHARALLGRVDVVLHAAKTVLHETASMIDRDPSDPQIAAVQRTRLVVEEAATLTLDLCGQALGASPYCRNPAFARRAADLPVFLRQSHAQRDYESLGQRVSTANRSEWLL